MEENSVIKVSHVQRIKRSDGRVDLYFRKGDVREGPLQSPDGTVELKAEVEAILARLLRAQSAAKQPLAGTVGGLLKQYNRSSEYLSNARSTQHEYQYYIDELIEDCGDMPLADVTRSWIIEMRDAWALRGHRAANLRMQVLKNALAPAIEDENDHRISGDPFTKVKKVRRPADHGEAHPTWEDEEVSTAIEDAISRDQPGLARAIALGRYGGFRRGTIVQIPLNARRTGYDADGAPHARLHWITEKRQVLADKPEDSRLTDVIKRTPNRALTIAYNMNGGSFKERQLNQALDRLMARLAKAGRVRAAMDDKGEIYCPLDLHGLRHSRGVELAIAGASDSQIMAQLEHSTNRAASIYRRQAQRRTLADGAQAAVDNVINIRALRKAKDAANG